MNSQNISPHVYVFTTFVCAVIGFLMFYQYHMDERYYFIPVFLLAAFYGVINFARQCKNPHYYAIARNINFLQLLRRSVARYLVWLLIIYTASQFYLAHPFYSTKDFEAGHVFFEKFLNLYLIAGLPYFLVTLVLKSSRIEDYYDPAIRLIHMFKQVTVRLLRRANLSSIFFVFRKQYNRKILLILLVRAYFIPTMIIQVYINLYNAVTMTEKNYADHSILSFLFFVSAILWLMDTINASMAYVIESRWTENRPRSIDMTIGGWLVCLSCYAPLNMVTGTLFPWAPSVETNNSVDLLFDSIGLLYAVKIAEVLMLAAHIYTDVSLGPSVANITLRKLQTRGFYSFIRHPGTTLKLSYFLLSSIFFKVFWQFRFIYGYLMWGMVYVLRAITEERHLKHFAEYREYMKKVKYRFLPGIF